MKESKLKKALKRIEHAIRRGFIASLKFRSRFRSIHSDQTLPLHLSENPTILFLRQDKLGDAIISTPLLMALYEKYSNAHFIMLLGKNNQGIADLLPIPCETIVYKKKPLSDIAMLRRLRKRKIEVLIDLMDNPSSTSSIIIPAISAKYSVGIEKENSSSYNVIVPLLDRSRFHITRRLLELGRPFGIDPDSVSLQATLAGAPIEKITGRLGLVISAGVTDRELLPEVNSRIITQALSKEYVKQVMIFYHPKDKALAQSIVDRVDDADAILAPTTNTFAGYAQMLRTCEYIITPDTSAVHLCTAYGIPVIVITNPFPPELHYWTPIGVPYELIAATPSVKSADPAEVISHLDSLYEKVHEAALA